MIDKLPPAAILIAGGLLVPFFRGRALKLFLLALPLLALGQAIRLFGLEPGSYLELQLFDYTLTFLRIDRLSLVFGLIFSIVALLSVVYALHVKDRLQHAAGLIYAGAGVAAVHAGDLISLFIFWELTAISSVFLIWARRTQRSYDAGMRYLIIQVGSGVLLLAGVLFHSHASGSIAFGFLGTGTIGTNLILVAFGIKCAFPFLHNWLQDAYPEATVTGTVFLSAFTTKLAIYALARGYPGTAILVPIGIAMMLFPIFYAVIENDLRRVLAYSLNNQLGFMVVGIGIGTEMAINGATAHAFAHLLYKALLFMAMGAVLHRTGTIRASELGGLYRSMPFTTVFCIIGAMSISAFPLFSGFVSKSLILTGAAEASWEITLLFLIVASAGVMEHSGIKIPFFAFFAHDSGIRCKEAPFNMLLAMGVTAFLCIAIGVWPEPLYALLPYPVDYAPYTPTHVLTQLQLLLFSALAFFVLYRYRLYPAEMPGVNLDTDWIYRRLFPAAMHRVTSAGTAVRDRILAGFDGLLGRAGVRVYRRYGPGGLFARTWETGNSALWVALLLFAFLILYYL